MKFVYNIYVLVFIFRSTWEVQNAADFTLDELTHLSQKLNPMECMRLLEAIYLAIPKDKERSRVLRETPVNKRLCLNELEAWNQQFSDKTEPKARDVMFLHLNALGRADLANWVRKNRESLNPVFSNYVQFREDNEEVDQENRQISKYRISKRDTNENRPDLRHYFNTKRITHRTKRAKIHHPMIATISGQAVRNERHASPGKSQSVKSKHGISRNSVFLMIALGIVVIFICGIVFLMFRRSLRNSLCCNERSYLCPGNDTTYEKGLQCTGCLDDNDGFDSQTTRTPSQISEIDIEGGSCVNSVGNIDGRKSYSDTVLHDEGITPRISVEELELLDEESVVENPKETQPLSSCRCRPLVQKICGSKPKRRKKKAKTKPKEDTKTTKNYLKAMQEKILPRQRRQIKKDCTFDMKQFQDKILTLLNQECGVCQCCNCTPHWEVVASKVKNRSTREEERCVKPERKECKKNRKPKRDKCENLSITKGCNKEVLTYQASVTSRSPMSGRRSGKEQESDSRKKCKIKTKEKSRKLGSHRTKRAKDDRVLLSSSSSSDADQPQKRSKFRSGRSSKELDGSANTLLSAHDKPKRFF